MHVMNFSSFLCDILDEPVVEESPLNIHQLHLGRISGPAAISVSGGEKPVDMDVVFPLDWLRAHLT